MMRNLLYLSLLTLSSIILIFSCSSEEELVVETTNQIVEIPIEDKLPQVYLNTNSQEIPDEPKIIAEISIENKGEITYEAVSYTHLTLPTIYSV